METIGQRLKRLREGLGLSQGALASAAGLKSQGTIGNIERETRGYGDSVVDIARVLGVTPDYLRCNETDTANQSAIGGHPTLIDLENNPEYPAIRRVAFKLSAGASGFGVEYRDDDGAPIVFQRKWYSDNGFDPASLFAVRVANGSMESGLYDGDTVVVNTKSTDPKDGVVFAVNYEGEMVIKRLVRDAGQWWLVSDNPDQRRYPRKVCDEHSRIIGEVVHKQSMRI